MKKLFVALIYLSLCINELCSAAPAEQHLGMACAEYIAAGMNAVPESDTSDYNYDDENSSSNEDTEYKQHDEDNAIEKMAGVVQCTSRQQFCFSVWKVDAIGNATIVRQGCWQSDDKQTPCHNTQCISNSRKTISYNHRFCCCTGNMCNQNTTIFETIREIDQTQYSDSNPSPLAPLASIWKAPIVWICVTVTSLLAIALGVFLACHSSKKAEPELAPLAPSGPGYSSNLHNVDNLKLCAMIGQGKYGTVWKGMVNEQPVAVKIFPSQYKQYFINERNIYSLPLMDSASLLEYYGCDTRRTLNDNIEYLLVMSLAPLGCLQDWLIENTSTFTTFTKMAKSIARGLSHLHTALKKEEMEKPCICHRDVNTRNILVKADLSCCIADFGFALKTYGARYECKGEITLAETKSINEVGTLRYMAPEVLEGAVNLRDCETALKQIDVYALGLVLWELCVRCQDWYPSNFTLPPYKSPYEAEVGKNPSFEHMQILVSRHKARPSFPQNWGGDSASSQIAKETCEDCWDHDAEARLTALCVEERMNELSILGPTAQTTKPSPSLSSNESLIYTPSASTVPCHSNYITSPTKMSIYQNNVTTNITPPNQVTPMVYNSCSENTAETVVNVTTTGILKNRCNPDQHVTTVHNFAPSDRNENNFCRSEDSVEDLIASSASYENISQRPPLKGWYGVRALIQKNLFKRNSYNIQRVDDKTYAADEKLTITIDVNPSPKSAAQQIVNIRPQLDGHQKTQHHQQRPNNLDLICQVNVNHTMTTTTVPPARHPKQLTSIDDLNGFRKPPGDRSNQSFAIISNSPRIVISKSATTVKQLSSLEAMDDVKLKRQRSLEVFREVFGAKGSIERLRDPSQRVKTPGDVPPSVRKIRASKTLSLYDDRMMDTSGRNSM